MDILDKFDKEILTTYKDENYFVRDNGAVLRQRKLNGRKRPLDEQWTFGKKNKQKGYMFIGSHEVHRIVAYAFLGNPPSNKHVIDHIDTNKCNNRPENLRWVTRLENIILNPITLKRIELAYGSLENFFKDPKAANNIPQNIAWMRTVSKEEANLCRKNLLKWANSNIDFKNGSLNEWIYETRNEYTSNPFSLDDKKSLTYMAIQRNWKWLCEFPSCPDLLLSDPLKAYLEKLNKGVIFTKNKYGQSIVEMAGQYKNHLSIIAKSNNIKPWSVSKITFENGKYIHEPIGSFFELNGAKKEYYKLLNIPFEGKSIDDYCSSSPSSSLGMHTDIQTPRQAMLNYTYGKKQVLDIRTDTSTFSHLYGTALATTLYQQRECPDYTRQSNPSATKRQSQALCLCHPRKSSAPHSAE